MPYGGLNLRLVFTKNRKTSRCNLIYGNNVSWMTATLVISEVNKMFFKKGVIP